MYLRFARRRKAGKEHRYWSIVESKRCAGGRVVQRPVLYLGEINDGQREAWCRQIEAFDEASGRHRQLALFPAERAVPEHAQGFGWAGAARCDGVASSAPMGRVLARLSSLRAVGTGSVLCAAVAELARGHQ